MTQYDNPNLSIDEVLQTLPDHVMKDQFRNKLIDRRSEKGKVMHFFQFIYIDLILSFSLNMQQISEINKKNRVKQKAHHSGAKRFAKRTFEAVCVHLKILK